MEIPSFILSPCAAVLLSRSEPARSTMLNLLVTTINSSFAGGLGAGDPYMDVRCGMPEMPDLPVKLEGGTVLVVVGVPAPARKADIPTVDEGRLRALVGVFGRSVEGVSEPAVLTLFFWTRVREKMA